MSGGEQLDALIVGGGPAGTAAAIVLAGQGRRVMVLERRARYGWTIGETLPPAANPLLQRLGLHAQMQWFAHLPSYGALSCWGKDDLTERDFTCDLFGPGWQIDRAKFETHLADAARNQGAVFQCRSQLVSVNERRNGRWSVDARLDGRMRRLSPAWIVDATGRRCQIAKLLGAHRRHADQLVCVYSTATPSADGDADCDTRTLVEAVPNGWWYTARTPNGRRTIAWLTDGALLRCANWRTLAGFSKLVDDTRELSRLLSKFDYRWDQTPKCVSASSSRLDSWTGNGWLAVGDAAFSMDPLSSQGLFHALASGIVAAETMIHSTSDETKRLREYSKNLEIAWSDFLRNRRTYYRMETRWPHEPFWHRRR